MKFISRAPPTNFLFFLATNSKKNWNITNIFAAKKPEIEDNDLKWDANPIFETDDVSILPYENFQLTHRSNIGLFLMKTSTTDIQHTSTVLKLWKDTTEHTNGTMTTELHLELDLPRYEKNASLTAITKTFQIDIFKDPKTGLVAVPASDCTLTKVNSDNHSITMESSITDQRTVELTIGSPIGLGEIKSFDVETKIDFSDPAGFYETQSIAHEVLQFSAGQPQDRTSSFSTSIYPLLVNTISSKARTGITVDFETLKQKGIPSSLNLSFRVPNQTVSDINATMNMQHGSSVINFTDEELDFCYRCYEASITIDMDDSSTLYSER